MTKAKRTATGRRNFLGFEYTGHNILVPILPELKVCNVYLRELLNPGNVLIVDFIHLRVSQYDPIIFIYSESD